MGGYRNGARAGFFLSQWKAKHRPATKAGKILSKLFGFIGGCMEIVAVLGILVSMSSLKGVSFTGILLLWLGGLALDIGMHWVICQICGEEK